MRGYMFRNKWGALFFVAMTLAGVTKLVGTGDEDGSLQEATDQIAEQSAVIQTPPPAPAPSEPQGETIETLPSDEDLIDPATGIDPTPIDEFASDTEVAPDAAAVSVEDPAALSNEVPAQ